MRILKRFAVAAVLVVTSVSFSGCDWFDADNSDDGAREFIQSALENMKTVNTYKYNLTINGTGENEKGDTKFNAILYGEEDYSDPAAPKFNYKVSADVDMPEYVGKVDDLELRFDGSDLYAMISNLGDFGGIIPSEVSKSFVGKWWSIPIPQDALKSSLLFSNKIDPADMTPEELKMKEKFDNLTLLTDIKDKGLMNDYLHFEALLDKEEFNSYIKDVAHEAKGEMTDEEEESFDSLMEALDVDVEVWISEKDNLIHRFVATVAMHEDGVDFDIVVDADIVAFDEDVVVDVPSASEEFDPLMLLGLSGGLQ